MVDGKAEYLGATVVQLQGLPQPQHRVLTLTAAHQVMRDRQRPMAAKKLTRVKLGLMIVFGDISRKSKKGFGMVVLVC